MGNSLRARVRARALSVCGVVLGVFPLTAPGQPSNYPTKPIRFLVANAVQHGITDEPDGGTSPVDIRADDT